MIEKSSDLHDKRERKTPIVAPDFISGGQLGLILAGLAITVANMLVVRPASGLSFFDAAGFALLAIPGLM